ncbi:LAFA_0C07382g1_1 [Lachancea sp. 'fantastica']|nr:LAFA_0C07382g1_1 [Lachancea sp. 'fantastica']
MFYAIDSSSPTLSIDRTNKLGHLHTSENVHGVFAPHNVQFRPGVLGEFQKYAVEKCKAPAVSKLLYLVFHSKSPHCWVA